MTRDYKTLKTTVSRMIFVGFVASTITGCALPPKPEKADYRQNHKIQVAREQVSVSVVLPQHGLHLAPGDMRRFRSFLRDFVQRGRTVVTVESTAPQLARDILLANGLRENEIIIAPGATVAAPNVVLSFTASKVVVPECGDWTSGPSFNMSNGPHSNFGCSVQRNVGQVVADPGDFIQQQPATGGAATRTDEGIRVHQSGAPKTRLLDGGGSAGTTTN